MNEASKPTAWDMVETLTSAGLVVPPLGATDPTDIQRFGKWHWGTCDLDRIRDLYLFNVESVARNLIEHGPMFAISHGGHGANSYALSLVTTAPSGDVAYFTQHGIFGAYSDHDRDRASVNTAHLELAQEWVKLDEATAVGPIRWLAFESRMRWSRGIVDLDALRAGSDFESAYEAIEFGDLFEELRERRQSRPKSRASKVTKPATKRGRSRRSASPRRPGISEITPHLAEALRRLQDDSHLVITVRNSIRYVQFATFRPNLRLETIGTRYLEDAGESWSVDEVVWLAEHGWHDADDDGNLWRHWIPADEDEAAAAAVDALINVHGVTSLDQVWFQSGDDNALAALEGHSSSTPAVDPTRRIPPGFKVVAVVDYVAQNSVLELLALEDGDVLRRHDPEWSMALAKAPARSIVPLTQELFDRVRSKVDASTAGQPWTPFKVATLEMYWPSHRPNDPDLFDWGQLDDLGDLQEP
jgi:hypothetical protein